MGKHDWLVNTLDDMAEYAKLNDLPLVSAAICNASSTAVESIALQDKATQAVVLFPSAVHLR
jgi:hypothetical protein